MPYSALLEYIRKAKTCGAPDDEIIGRLMKAGWYRVDAQDALELYAKLTAVVSHPGDCEPLRPPPQPSVTERLVPHHYDPRLISVAALTFALGFVAYMLLSR